MFSGTSGYPLLFKACMQLSADAQKIGTIPSRAMRMSLRKAP